MGSHRIHRTRLRERGRRASRVVRRLRARARPCAPWSIVAVFDPEGLGSDFAYTVGLDDLGLPELHVWARPTDGSDPGADFCLSPQDQGDLLDLWAERLVAGEAGPGSVFDVTFDGGACSGTFEMGPAVHPMELGATLVTSYASVIPVRWALHR